LRHPSISVNNGVRLEGAGWDHGWDGWRSIHAACKGWGVRFLSVNYSEGDPMGSPEQTFCLATILLDWEPR